MTDPEPVGDLLDSAPGKDQQTGMAPLDRAGPAAEPASRRRDSPIQPKAGEGRVPPRELLLVAGIVLLGLALRVAIVLVTKDQALVGDELEYDAQGRFIAQGKWFWSTTPSGIPHPSMWKAPGYPLFVGALYQVLGTIPGRVLLVQTLLGALTVGLTWVLARRLFGPLVAVTAAAIAALYPFAWQFEVRLFPESLVTPLTLVLLMLVLEREVSTKRAVLVGALLATIVLIRPSALYLVPGVLVAWLLVGGVRRGAALSAVTVFTLCLLVAPWTLRNHRVSGDFVPISVQDAALYGVFNDDAARDPVNPWAWRYRTTRDRDVVAARRRLSEARLRRILRARAFDYIEAHPESVAKAFFWNGLSRLWDVRRPSHILREAAATGRLRRPTQIALVAHYLLLPLAVAGLWLARRRRGLVLPILVTALAASVVFTADATTRYRAPFEPLIVIFAVFAVSQIVTRLLQRSEAPPVGARTAGPAGQQG